MPTITVGAKTANLSAVLDFIHEQLAETTCPPKAILHIDLAVEEMFVNVANYAYSPKEGPVRITCELHEDPAGIAIIMADSGNPFNPLDQPEADTTLSAEDRVPGGLGILLTRKLMDSLQYEYRDGENVLTLNKNF